LSIVGFILVHPTNDDWVIAMFQTNLVLLADDGHSRFPEQLQLLFRRTFPQANIQVDACFLEAFVVSGILKPHGDGKEVWVFWRTKFPTSIRG